MLKRISLFVLTNLLVVITIIVITSLLGVNRFIYENGIYISELLILSLVVGFTGSLFSLWISRWMAIQLMGVYIIHPQQPRNNVEQMLVEKVHELAKKAGLPVMPKVGIYDSPEVNAFATGPSKRRSLVAVSTGLLQHMDEQAIEGVLAHEIAHIANGDMVTMTLLQGIINTFVEFLSRVISFIISKFVREELAHIVYLISYFVFSMVFSLLGILVVFAFSRKREYAADKGGAKLAGKEKMIHALRQLQSSLGWIDNSHAAVSTLKINNQQKHSLFSTLFSTHPSLEERIEYLQTLK